MRDVEELLKIAVEVLGFYAAEENHENIMDSPSSEVYADFGARAREVLKLIDNSDT